jgi:hypothetical protein
VAKASGGQTACVICRSTAQVTQFEPDLKRPGRYHPVSYCTEHDPQPTTEHSGPLPLRAHPA